MSVGPEQTSILATSALLDTRCSCSAGSLPDSVTAGACGDSMFKHSNYKTVFQRGCTILYSCQQSTVVLVSFLAFDPKCEVACGQLWFADEECSTSYTSHAYSFTKDMSSPTLCPLFNLVISVFIAVQRFFRYSRHSALRYNLRIFSHSDSCL